MAQSQFASPPDEGNEPEVSHPKTYRGRIAAGEYPDYKIDWSTEVHLTDDRDWPEIYSNYTLLENGNEPVISGSVTQKYLSYVGLDAPPEDGLFGDDGYFAISVREWLAYWQSVDSDGEISLVELRDEWAWLYDMLTDHPLAALHDAELALRSLSGNYRASVDLVDIPEESRERIEALRARDEGRLVVADVLVETRSKHDDECYLVTGTCDTRSCDNINPVWQERFETSIAEPDECSGHATNTPVTNTTPHYYTKQEILIRDLPSLAGRPDTEPIAAEISRDMVYSVETGQRVRVVGAIRRNTTDSEKRASHYMQILGIDVPEEEFAELEVTDEEQSRIEELASEEDIVDRLADSIAPELSGGDEYDLARKAILHQLVGGKMRDTIDAVNDASKGKRGTIHIGLVGDPALGKSVLGECATRIAPKSKYVDAESTTAVGLKGSVQRVEEFGTAKWTVSAGALPTANRGLVVADELDKTRNEEAQALHNPMAKGVVDINKANIDTTLEARTSILAIANPDGQRFNADKELRDQIPIPPALWSRFDVVVPFEDDPSDSEQNEAMANYAEKVSGNSAEFSEEFLTKYVAYARQTDPELTEEAAQALDEFWRAKREESDGDRVPLTNRDQDAMYRFAQASARLRLSEDIEVEDIRRAKDIVVTALQMVSESDELDADRVTAGPSARQREMIEVAEEVVSEALRHATTNAVDVEQIMAIASNQQDWDKATTLEALDLAVSENRIWKNQAGYGVVDDA